MAILNCKGIYDFIISNKEYICETLFEGTETNSVLRLRYKIIIDLETIVILTESRDYAFISPKDEICFYRGSDKVRGILLDMFTQYKRDNKINEILN